MVVISEPRLRSAQTALLTTYRRDGRAVSTIVSALAHGGRAYFVTPADSGKVRRLRHDERVALTRCTRSGRPLGDPVPGRAVPHARDAPPSRWFLLSPWRPLFWSWALFRVRGRRVRFYAIRPEEVGRRGAP